MISLTKNEVILCELRSSDLLRQSLSRVIDIDEHVVLLHDGLHFLGVVNEALADRNDRDLTWGQP